MSTMSMPSNRPPGRIVRTGRTLAYRSKVFRSATLTERKPSPTGVSSGPFSARRVLLIDSSVASGIGSFHWATPACPAVCLSQAIDAPAASRMRTVASVMLGPMPSPGIRVIRVLMRLGEGSWRGEQVGDPPREAGRDGGYRRRRHFGGDIAGPLNLGQACIDE